MGLQHVSLLLCLACADGHGAVAESPVAAALTSATGQVLVIRGIGGKQLPGKVGMALRADDQLALGKDAVASLLFTTGEQKKLTGPGKHAVAVPKSPGGLAEVGKRLWQAVSTKFRGVFRGEDYGWGAPEGGITRGMPGLRVAALTPLRPRGGWGVEDIDPDQVQGGGITFEWTPAAGEGAVAYSLEIRAPGRQPLTLSPRSVSTVKDSLGLTFARALVTPADLPAGTVCTWRVVARSAGRTARSQSTTFVVLPPKDWTEIAAAASALKDAPATLGAFYEQEGCFSLAREQYSRAAALSPDDGGPLLLLADLYHVQDLPGLAEAARRQAKKL